jgi:hypothetical protein
MSDGNCLSLNSRERWSCVLDHYEDGVIAQEGALDDPFMGSPVHSAVNDLMRGDSEIANGDSSDVHQDPIGDCGVKKKVKCRRARLHPECSCNMS